MKKASFIALFACALMVAPQAAAQVSTQKSETKYLAGAVPVKDGFVEFDHTYKVSGKNHAQIFEALRNYVQTQIVEGPDHLPQARITEHNAEEGIIAANIQEYLYFKRKAWQTHRVRFSYQLVCHIEDNQFTITMRNLRYEYDPEVSPAGESEVLRAEEWITDKEALDRKGRLTRKAGKFRSFTIDRKNEVFEGAAKAVGAKRKVMKMVEVEE